MNQPLPQAFPGGCGAAGRSAGCGACGAGGWAGAAAASSPCPSPAAASPSSPASAAPEEVRLRFAGFSMPRSSRLASFSSSSGMTSAASSSAHGFSSGMAPDASTTHAVGSSTWWPRSCRLSRISSAVSVSSCESGPTTESTSMGDCSWPSEFSSLSFACTSSPRSTLRAAALACSPAAGCSALAGASCCSCWYHSASGAAASAPVAQAASAPAAQAASGAPCPGPLPLQLSSSSLWAQLQVSPFRQKPPFRKFQHMSVL
mmetsp:Transcript_99182/g.241185  ORF Transcript_99182/g.241185 Transcript_99182/m.241185 type:complete len:260 (-) Transcript_99182:59-838(-)